MSTQPLTPASRPGDPRTRPRRIRPAFAIVDTPSPAAPSAFVATTGVLTALWCACFAAVNVWLEVTGEFRTGPNAAHADTLSVLNWYVVVVKLVGMTVALFAVAHPPPVRRPGIVGAFLWAGSSTLTVYVLGSTGQAIGMLTGIAGDSTALDASAAGYLLGFLFAAIGFGILTISYTRRLGITRVEASIGVCAGPLVLASVLVFLPALLRCMGLSPAA